MSTDKVKVAVRVRPFNRREVDLKTKCVVEMTETQTILHHYDSKSEGEGRKLPKSFTFDNCFFSFDASHSSFAGQEKVYMSLGEGILDTAFKGYNACIFAYGQTGSGKSFSMMGSPGNEGIIPRLCNALFDRIAKNEDQNLLYKVEVSYMEIYNEKVHDLLNPKGTKQNLRVREHNILGPYVDGLSILAVSSFEDIRNLMEQGNKSRTVAATNMNNESSRSHAVFNVILTCSETDVASGVTGEKVSKMSLVDLAGSERAVKTGAVGDRLKEGSNINKSLTTLGLVISKLADQSSSRAKDKFVPYRDSVLTWLLKDNLGGNSKTVMVATISPAADNYEETLSTLRYADRAKRIVNHAVVNEDPNARIIRELRAEVEALKDQLKKSSKQDGTVERLEESERLMKEISETWEEKVSRTEQIHQERQQTLEKMGISVQASGIKVEKFKCYLVNLNADPSLNELLVYYLKEKTLIGRPNAPVEQDIQLNGLGIMPEHCFIEMENNVLHLTPMEEARTCVNGSVITSRTQIRHGDRVLWGNNHFFRVNCPKSVTSPTAAEEITRPIDYEFAREELMMKEMSNNPIQSAMNALERQHEEDKQGALHEQRQMYEKQLRMLRNQMSPTTPYAPYGIYDSLGFKTPTGFPPNSSMQSKVEKWSEDRDELFRISLAKLREDVVKANASILEANSLAKEMNKRTEFHVTLQIPAANLSPNRKKSAFVSEPAILVKRDNTGSQVWSMEKLENKLIDMREYYNEFKDKEMPVAASNQKILDPFYESQENHNLIGVANVFLEVLFHDVKLDYQVPIISQQGEVAGRLHVEICRIAGNIQDRMNETSSDSSDEGSRGSLVDISDNDGAPAQIVCQVHIKAATGLPPSLSNFVFCQYRFWGYNEGVVVAPIVNPENPTARKGKESMIVKFDHVKEFSVIMTEEFIEHCSEGALSIEVWGHRCSGFGSTRSPWEIETKLKRSKSLADRWSESIRKIELWAEIDELNEQGEYAPVEISTKTECLTGGIYQLRQGQQRRINVKVKPVLNSGTLPIIVESISSIAIGSVCTRLKLQKGLDSYQEEDLTLLREKWSDALMKRREYLDEQIQKLIHRQDKSSQDSAREKSLIEQWVCLTEERNAVLIPTVNSKLPGAPADWNPKPGMEKHIPVLFLDLNADDLTTSNAAEGTEAAGANSILPKEHGGKLFNLPIISFLDKDVGAIASWDSSIHDSIHLNRVTPPNERVYLILKVTVRLSHPATMELVLRKRLSINVYKKQSFTNMIKKRIVRMDCPSACGVTYEVVSNIPKAFEDVEDRETLALMAASGEDSGTGDGETYIEKYTRGVSAVESILTLDKLRQEVAIKELLAAQGRPLRKTASVPNISHGFTWADMSASSSNLSLVDDPIRSDSISDLPSALSCDNFDKFRRRSDHSTPSKDGLNKPFGLARPTFLNLNLNLNLRSPSSKTGVSPQLSKLVKPMKTLMEEQNVKESKSNLLEEVENEALLNDIEENEPEEDIEFDEFQSYESQSTNNLSAIPEKEPVSSTVTINHVTISETDVQQTKTPSMSSSGYSSHALSSTTLSSEDSLSVKSISVDDTSPDDSKHTTSQVIDSLIDFNCTTLKTTNDVTATSNCSNDLIGLDLKFNALHISEEDLRESKSLKSEQNVVSELEVTSEDQNNPKLDDQIPDNVTFDDQKPETLDESNSVNEEDVESEDDNFELSKEERNLLPSWICVGESVTTRPGNKPGVISYVGRTAFAKGAWIGVELDAPMGKNDGSVNNIRYFQCKPRFGVFVRADKLALDKRGRMIRDKNVMQKSTGDGLNTAGLRKTKTKKDQKSNHS